MQTELVGTMRDNKVWKYVFAPYVLRYVYIMFTTSKKLSFNLL